MKHVLLLQGYLGAPHEDDTLKNLAIYVIAALIVIFITRAIFSIPAIVKNLRAQTHLAAMTAAKQGVDIGDVKKVMDYLKGDRTVGELPEIKAYDYKLPG